MNISIIKQIKVGIKSPWGMPLLNSKCSWLKFIASHVPRYSNYCIDWIDTCKITAWTISLPAIWQHDLRCVALRTPAIGNLCWHSHLKDDSNRTSLMKLSKPQTTLLSTLRSSVFSAIAAPKDRTSHSGLVAEQLEQRCHWCNLTGKWACSMGTWAQFSPY